MMADNTVFIEVALRAQQCNSEEHYFIHLVTLIYTALNIDDFQTGLRVIIIAFRAQFPTLQVPIHFCCLTRLTQLPSLRHMRLVIFLCDCSVCRFIKQVRVAITDADQHEPPQPQQQQ